MRRNLPVIFLFLFMVTACTKPVEVPPVVSTSTPIPPTPIPPTPTPAWITQVSPVDGMVQVYVPEGDFLMGSPDGVGYDDEYPQHVVYLDGYWIDQTEVTNEMFSSFVEATGYETDSEYERRNVKHWNSQTGKYESSTRADWAHPQGLSSDLSGLEDHPVVHVSWNDAQAYCAWAGRRLPTEAEWEKAARGENGQTYPWGNDIPSSSLANYGYNEKSTTEVGSFPAGASPYGALDMAGNVWEWVADWYGAYPSGPETNPQGPAIGEYRGLRGGSWNMSVDLIRSALRNRDVSELPRLPYLDDGFRCAASQP